MAFHPDFDDSIRGAIEDLQNSLGNGQRWSNWEEEFIENISQKLSDTMIEVSEKQENKIRELWEKIY